MSLQCLADAYCLLMWKMDTPEEKAIFIWKLNYKTHSIESRDIVGHPRLTKIKQSLASEWESFGQKSSIEISYFFKVK